jgi:hypothetical protein
MAEINHSVLAAAGALVLTACAGSALANDANTNAALGCHFCRLANRSPAEKSLGFEREVKI